MPKPYSTEHDVSETGPDEIELVLTTKRHGDIETVTRFHLTVNEARDLATSLEFATQDAMRKNEDTLTAEQQMVLENWRDMGIEESHA